MVIPTSINQWLTFSVKYLLYFVEQTFTDNRLMKPFNHLFRFVFRSKLGLDFYRTLPNVPIIVQKLCGASFPFLPNAIKALGEYDVTARVGAGVSAHFKVKVKAS